MSAMPLKATELPRRREMTRRAITGGQGFNMPIAILIVAILVAYVGYALIYPIAVPAVCFVLSLFLMPETRKISIWNPETKTA